jgi:hypothetical protein
LPDPYLRTVFVRKTRAQRDSTKKTSKLRLDEAPAENEN